MAELTNDLRAKADALVSSLTTSANDTLAAGLSDKSNIAPPLSYQLQAGAAHSNPDIKKLKAVLLDRLKDAPDAMRIMQLPAPEKQDFIFHNRRGAPGEKITLSAYDMRVLEGLGGKWNVKLPIIDRDGDVRFHLSLQNGPGEILSSEVRSRLRNSAEVRAHFVVSNRYKSKTDHTLVPVYASYRDMKDVYDAAAGWRMDKESQSIFVLNDRFTTPDYKLSSGDTADVTRYFEGEAPDRGKLEVDAANVRSRITDMQKSLLSGMSREAKQLSDKETAKLLKDAMEPEAELSKQSQARLQQFKADLPLLRQRELLASLSTDVKPTEAAALINAAFAATSVTMRQTGSNAGIRTAMQAARSLKAPPQAIAPHYTDYLTRTLSAMPRKNADATLDKLRLVSGMLNRPDAHEPFLAALRALREQETDTKLDGRPSLHARYDNHLDKTRLERSLAPDDNLNETPDQRSTRNGITLIKEILKPGLYPHTDLETLKTALGMVDMTLRQPRQEQLKSAKKPIKLRHPERYTRLHPAEEELKHVAPALPNADASRLQNEAAEKTVKALHDAVKPLTPEKETHPSLPQSKAQDAAQKLARTLGIAYTPLDENAPLPPQMFNVRQQAAKVGEKPSTPRR